MLVIIWVTVPLETVTVVLPDAAFVAFKPECPSTNEEMLDVGLPLLLGVPEKEKEMKIFVVVGANVLEMTDVGPTG